MTRRILTDARIATVTSKGSYGLTEGANSKPAEYVVEKAFLD